MDIRRPACQPALLYTLADGPAPDQCQFIGSALTMLIYPGRPCFFGRYDLDPARLSNFESPASVRSRQQFREIAPGRSRQARREADA